jgi:hypothetical protein
MHLALIPIWLRLGIHASPSSPPRQQQEEERLPFLTDVPVQLAVSCNWNTENIEY